MMLQLLLLGILVAAVLQPTVNRVIPALCYALLTVFHYVAFDRLDGPYYYYVAGIVDLVCMGVIYRYAPKTQLAFEVSLICFVSIIINAVGWVIYMLYLPPDAYNMLFVALYIWAILVLLKKDGRDATWRSVGDHRLGGWIFGLRPTDYSRLHIDGEVV